MRAVVVQSILTLSLAASASAGELAGVALPDRIQVDSRTLVLNGMGLREATFLKVDVYVAGLYLETKSSDPDAIVRSEQAKRLVMKFVRAVGRKDLVKAWDESFQESAGASLAALKDRVATLDSYMSDVPNGALMSFTYLPGSGVTVEVQGAAKGVIAGTDFSQALFGIWLGSHPPNPGLKDGLLGGRRAPSAPRARPHPAFPRGGGGRRVAGPGHRAPCARRDAERVSRSGHVPERRLWIVGRDPHPRAAGDLHGHLGSPGVPRVRAVPVRPERRPGDPRRQPGDQAERRTGRHRVGPRRRGGRGGALPPRGRRRPPVALHPPCGKTSDGRRRKGSRDRPARRGSGPEPHPAAGVTVAPARRCPVLRPGGSAQHRSPQHSVAVGRVAEARRARRLGQPVLRAARLGSAQSPRSLEDRARLRPGAGPPGEPPCRRVHRPFRHHRRLRSGCRLLGALNPAPYSG